MAPPDFLRSRRALRQARIQSALQMPVRAGAIKLHRDRLLEQLVRSADRPVRHFDELAPDVVDTVVSIAVAEVNEETADALGVSVLCAAVLAADGQFARLRVLADRLEELSRRISHTRPYLKGAIQALALTLRGDQSGADQVYASLLHPDDDGAAPPPRSREQLNDILLLASVRASALHDDAFIERAKTLALRLEDGPLLAFLDSIAMWNDRAGRAAPTRVLAEADPLFASGPLHTYVAERGIRTLFPAQLTAIEGGAVSAEDRVVALPTSSGKTLVAEFRIASTLTRLPGTRAIYVAPYRMLARQVARSMGTGLKGLGLSVRDLGSRYDADLDAGDQLGLPDVAICTPERLDGLMRSATSGEPGGLQARDLFTETSLLIFDELQMIGREGRGPRFELLITRIRERYPQIEFLGLCAGSQGADQLAQWLTSREAISGASRPTGTLEVVWGTDGVLKQRADPRPSQVGEIARSTPREDAADLILRIDRRWLPALAVETQRAYAEDLANSILDRGPAQAADWRGALDSADLRRISLAVEEIKAVLGDGHPLVRCVENGIAFHHAGVPTHVLRVIERLAVRGLLRAICATTTVAEGSDLPFRSVVIPHLNFPGRSRRLERDLYLNIVGRAGRANVSMEGLVFVLDSDARTLRNLVHGSLWRAETGALVRGRIAEVGTSLASIQDWVAYADVQSQVMGWLGDGDSYVDNQAQHLASRTLSWQQASARERRSIEALMTDALEDLEARGYAAAGSPFRLTDRGKRARVTGLSPATVERLELALDTDPEIGVLGMNAGALSTQDASIVARLVLESVEVTEKSLWLRHERATEGARVEALLDFGSRDSSGDRYETRAHIADIELISAWLLGARYAELASLAPSYSRANALFGGSDEYKRTSDAAEYIGGIAYSASWVWSGLRLLAAQRGIVLPAYVRESLELGVPSEAATVLVRRTGVTRAAALAVAGVAGGQWSEILGWLAGPVEPGLGELGLTTRDSARLLRFGRQARRRDGGAVF